MGVGFEIGWRGEVIGVGMETVWLGWNFLVGCIKKA